MQKSFRLLNLMQKLRFIIFYNKKQFILINGTMPNVSSISGYTLVKPTNLWKGMHWASYKNTVQRQYNTQRQISRSRQLVMSALGWRPRD